MSVSLPYCYPFDGLTTYMQKSQDRKCALGKMTFTDEHQRERWSEVVKPDFMSSEESGIENEEEVLIVRPLVWRSPQVNQLFLQLDDKVFLEKKPLARRQMKRHVMGNHSDRPMPIVNIPEWATAKI